VQAGKIWRREVAGERWPEGRILVKVVVKRRINQGG
jgi:hypothetical protein